MFQIIGAMAEFERALIQERVRAGLRNARAKGKRLGRPRVALNPGEIAALRAAGASWRKIARDLKVGVATVYATDYPIGVFLNGRTNKMADSPAVIDNQNLTRHRAQSLATWRVTFEKRLSSKDRTLRQPPEVDYQHMRKRLVTTTSQDAPHSGEGWLDLDSAATVEVTSEAKEYPVESALVSGEVRGWRAAASGAQTIRLIFDQPQELKRIALVFEENETERTQEFMLRWSSDGGRSFRELVRQQWNFSPPNTTRETEEHNVQLSDVTVLELVIVPDINRGAARASLKSLRVS